MPIDRNKLLRYKVLDECFRDTSRLHRIGDLVERCNNELLRLDLKPVSRRTVQLDLQTMQGEPYNVEFDAQLLRSHYYRYADLSYTLTVLSLTATNRDALQQTIAVLRERYSDADYPNPQWQWMLSTLETIAAGRTVLDGEFVSFENNASFSGNAHFSTLLESITNRRPVKVYYKPYNQHNTIELKIHPYHLKQYNCRWFLFCAIEGQDSLSNLALDRIHSVRPWHHSFRVTKIDFQHYFDNTIGVSVNTNMVEEQITLRVKNQRYPYIESKPFSERQRIVKHDERSHIITFPIKINNEFISTILSYGADIEVVHPYHLRNRIAHISEQMKAQYFLAQKDCTL